MPNYAYQVRDSKGGLSTGVLTAPNIQDASRMLRGDGRIVINLQEQAEQPLVAVRPKPVKSDDVIYLTNQLAVMVDTGVSLSDALDGIAEQTRHTGLRVMVADIAEQVKSGTTFSIALERHPKAFSSLFVNTVRASEVSGRLGEMLQELCHYMREQRQTRRQIRGAMLYPISMLAIAVLLLVAMMAFVMPRFRSIYEGKGAVLPLPTRILLNTSDFIVANWLLLIILTTAAAVALRYWLRSDSGRTVVHKYALQAPIIGPLLMNLYISRSFRTMGTMISSGVSMLEAVSITASIVGNKLFRQMWEQVGQQLKEGKTLTDEMFATSLIPHSVSQMVASGEKAGRLTDVMGRVAEFCDADMKNGIKAMTSLIEPIMIVVMGALVGGIAMALLLPIFNVSKLVAN